MSERILYLFDDRRARAWAPFTLTRPVGELLFGTRTLRARAEEALGAPCDGHLTRAALAGFDEPGASPVVAAEDVGSDSVRIFLSSRAVLDEPVDLEGVADGRLSIGGDRVGWVLPPGAPPPTEPWLRDPDRAPDGLRPEIALAGSVLEGPWDLVARTPERVARDAAASGERREPPVGVVGVGNGRRLIDPGAELEPGVVVDTRSGPVVLARGVRVEGPARLIGPLYVGPDTVILGGSVGGSAIGPACKVRGEVSSSVILGYSNKAHDGYLGHALVGRWVNLGALTTNSDLKNSYGTVRVWTPHGDVDTGLVKVGCFLGDHVKTGIGTLLTTGGVVGAGSNVFGAAMPPSVVPPFSWGSGVDLRDFRLDKFLDVAERVMARRGQSLTPGVRRILTAAWEATRTRRAE